MRKPFSVQNAAFVIPDEPAQLFSRRQEFGMVLNDKI